MALKVLMFISHPFPPDPPKDIFPKLDRLVEAGIMDVTMGYMPTQPKEVVEAARLAVKEAKDRGMRVLYFSGNLRSQIFDLYPEGDGILQDGAGASGYEIGPGAWIGREGIPQALFGMHHDAEVIRALGYDPKQVKAGEEWFYKWLHNLKPDEVKAFLETQVGIMDAIDWVLQEPDFLEYLSFKVDFDVARTREAYEDLKARDPRLLYAVSPRTATYATLCGCSFRRLVPYTDFLCPKHYFWHGYDGMYGTTYRWVRQIKEWNPSLPEELCFQFVYRLMGYEIPGLKSLDNWDQSLYAPEFFEKVVPLETKKDIFRVGDPERLSPWVGLHHGGVRMSAHHLRRILSAAQRAGLRRFTYWHYNDLKEEEWEVIRELSLG
ncbi:MAG: hypothetical protein QXO94_05975 [Candidatus Bathyarchaeia archaeon]